MWRNAIARPCPLRRCSRSQKARCAMSAETIAKVLGGRRAGGAWMVGCPAHEDRRPSLSVSAAKGGKVLVRCHAGCDQRDVIAALRTRGLWETAWKTLGGSASKHHRRVRNEPDPDAVERTGAALAIRASQPAEVNTC